MTIIKCDTCGKEVEKANDIRQIYIDYRSEGKQEYCDDCHYEFEKYIQDIKVRQEAQIKDLGIKYIRNLTPKQNNP